MQNEMAEEHMCSSRTSGPGLEEGKLDYLHCDCPYSPFQFLTKHDGMFANLFSQLQLKLSSCTLKKKKKSSIVLTLEKTVIAVLLKEFGILIDFRIRQIFL